VTGPAEHEALTSRAGDALVVRDVFDQMPAMLISLAGPDYLICAANAAVRDFLGRGELVGRSLRALLPGLARQRIFQLLDQVRETSVPVTGREWRVQLDGAAGSAREAYIDFALQPWLAPDGTVMGVLATGTDVTGRVRQQRAAQVSADGTERRPANTRDLTVSLQTALLPAAVPVLPQARVAATYLPGGPDAAGGDWFDAIPLGAGTIALIVGDVVGHSLAAATAMAQLRAVMAELLTAETDADRALRRLNMFAAREPSLRAATVVLAILDPATGALSYATCGHPPPLIAGADGATRYLAATGSGPLGTGPQQPVRTGKLGRGETMLLYSDGLVERPGHALADAQNQLALVAADAAARRLLPAGNPSTAAERVCRLAVEILTRTGYSDDVAALAVERLARPVPEVHKTVPGEANSLRVLRRVLTEWLAPLEPRPDDLDAAYMAVVEIVTNAIEHAYADSEPGPIDFSLSLTGDGEMQCTIADYGNWRPSSGAEADRGNGLMVARHLMDGMKVTHPRWAGGPAAGAPGTVVTLRQRLMRPAIMVSGATAQSTGSGGDTDFGIVTDLEQGSARARVLGAIDATSADRLLRRLLGTCKGGTLPLTVDLTGVTRLASAGVSALFELSRQLRLHEHDLSLVARAGSSVQRVLDLVCLPHALSAG
jgi:serine phosphatase RsbU (regulator of sigma subunit)/anti-sigma regulatory factor (Ser/Thr protein kinase)/anti-anti-sigma regulatory factor